MEDDPLGFHPEVWKQMAELGWLGLIIPEEYGGSGSRFMDLFVLLEEMGRACLVAPFFSTAMCTLFLLDVASTEQRQRLLPQIAKGKLILSLALTEPSGSYEAKGISTRAHPEGNSYLINGIKLFVHDAQVANYLICVTRTDEFCPPERGITNFLVDAKSPGITITPLPTIADDKQTEITFENVKVPAENMLGKLNEGWPPIARLVERAAIAKCAEMIGGADWTLENTIAYAKTRIQYGRPIGSFQVLQHYLADVWTEVNHVKRLVYYAAFLLDQGLPCSKEVAMAKAMMNDVYQRCTHFGVRIHGGIGTTRDHDMGLYYRRAKQAAVLFGSSEFWREKLASELGF
jgi:alkylation response protein AidB-like acyl-CoA dehydrogenase